MGEFRGVSTKLLQHGVVGGVELVPVEVLVALVEFELNGVVVVVVGTRGLFVHVLVELDVLAVGVAWTLVGSQLSSAVGVAVLQGVQVDVRLLLKEGKLVLLGVVVLSTVAHVASVRLLLDKVLALVGWRGHGVLQVQLLLLDLAQLLVYVLVLLELS